MLKPVLLAVISSTILLTVPACSQTFTVVPAPTLQPTATPDIEATVSAGVQQTIEARPKPHAAPAAAPRQVPTPSPTATPKAAATPRPTPALRAPSLASMHNTNYARWVEQRHPKLHRDIMNLPWVADGLDPVEKEAIDSILYTAVVDAATTESLIELPWLEDELHAGEKESVESFYFVAYEDASVAQDLAGMPFMQSHQAADVHALDGIRTMIRNGFTANLTSSQVYRQGITDEWAPIVAAAAATKSGAAIKEYLNDSAITVETGRYITAGLPLDITLVRQEGSNGQRETLEATHIAVTGTESIMRLPLPTRHVIVVFDPRAVTLDYFGTNHGYAISIKEENPDGGLPKLQNVLYHEVAHYWWRGNINWIDEGMADTIAATASLNRGHPWGAKPNSRKDCTTQNISSLGHAGQGHGQFHCNYYLGEKLFRDLQDRMNQGQFATAIQNLYRLSLEKPPTKSLEDYRASIEEVRQAFPEQREIIDLHYAGDLNAPHRWDPDDAINTRHHDAVAWTQKPAYQGGVVSFSGRLTGDAGLVARNIDEARRGGSATFTISEGTKYIGSILPELTGRSYWTLDDPADVVADLFRIEGNSFSVSFQWPAAAGSPIGKRIIVWGYINADRTPVFGSEDDALGTSFIR